MKYLTFINNIERGHQRTWPIHFLVSGKDMLIRNAILTDIVSKCKKNGDMMIIIDDTCMTGTLDYGIFYSLGYRVKNCISERGFLYNPFRLQTIKDMSRIRQLFQTMGYDEKQKGKLIAYLHLICHIESLRYDSCVSELTLEKLGEYCTAMAVERQVQYLKDSGRIDTQQQMTLLAKYAECASAAADLEDTFFLLIPFVGKANAKFDDISQITVFPINEFAEDEVLRNLMVQLFLFGLEDCMERKITVLLFDKGYGDRKCIKNFLKTSFSGQVDLHVFSEDIFTLCDASELTAILNRFSAKVYSRHSAMKSAEEIEKICGEIDVIKNSYNVTYDRRWRANKPLDVLLGRNKTESYTQGISVREPKYRKEMILSFPAGDGIIEYMGNTTLFSIK